MELRLVSPPLPQSYVVFLPVLAGEYPGAADEAESRRRLDRVLDEGPDLFLDLTEPGELEPYAHLLPSRARHVRMPLPRTGVPRAQHVQEIIDAINRAAADGWFLYVHDAHGVGRVGTVIGCWLAELEILDRDPIAFLDEARAGLVGRWRPSPATPEQRAFVRGWTRGRLPGASGARLSSIRATGGWVATPSARPDAVRAQPRAVRGGMR